ncbi:putative florfenicol exporter [Aspergillus karnatakaensis]|uniref:putative florfenicol exporter n=1 Tax=Aspergillus karnatakaensis TaxID=1810916 RepID=UPI003CCE1F9B
MAELTPTKELPLTMSQTWLDYVCLMKRRNDPISHTRLEKHAIVGLVTLSAFTAPFASTILFPSFNTLVKHFHTTETQVALTTTVFLIGLAIAPLWWSSLSQEYGRRPILLISFFLSAIAVIICAVSNSMPLLIVFRLIEAAGCSSAQSVGAGVISDVFIPTERGTALGWFYLGTLIGPLVAPIIGGALEIWLGWRANMYFMAIFTGGVALLTALSLPETLVRKEPATATAPPQSQPQPQPLPSTTSSLLLRIKRDLLAPLPNLKFLLTPSIALCTAYISICFASLYCFNSTLPYAYQAPPYNFSAIEIGLCYISNCLGYAIGSLLGGRLSDAALRSYQTSHPNSPSNPIVRLKSVWFGTPFVPLGLLVYGWLVERRVQWVAPLVGAFLFGLGLMLVTSTVMPFLVDVSEGNGASVVADLNLVRNVLAAVGTVVSPVAVRGVGFGWWMTVLAGLCACGVGCLGVVAWMERKRGRGKEREGGESV